jgi:hypothetical protein
LDLQRLRRQQTSRQRFRPPGSSPSANDVPCNTPTRWLSNDVQLELRLGLIERPANHESD